jgi:hypothetical protein
VLSRETSKRSQTGKADGKRLLVRSVEALALPSVESKVEGERETENNDCDEKAEAAPDDHDVAVGWLAFGLVSLSA